MELKSFVPKYSSTCQYNTKCYRNGRTKAVRNMNPWTEKKIQLNALFSTWKLFIHVIISFDDLNWLQSIIIYQFCQQTTIVIQAGIIYNWKIQEIFTNYEYINLSRVVLQFKDKFYIYTMLF